MLVGHRRQLKYLESIITSGMVPHAFIFAGPAHLGKKLVAQMFFWRLTQDGKSWHNFFEAENHLSRQIRQDSHPDVLLVQRQDGRADITIAQARDLKKFVALSPFQLKRKLVLIDEAENINREAQNALLKTIEEPQGDIILVLVTNNLSKMPRTIVSRAAVIHFQKVERDALLRGFSEMGHIIKQGELGWIAGRPGLAMKFLKEPSDDLVKNLRANFFSFLDVFGEKSIRQQFMLIEEIFSSENLPQILEAWMLAAYQTAAEKPKNSSYFLKIMNDLAVVKELVTETNVNKRLQLENSLLNR